MLGVLYFNLLICIPVKYPCNMLVLTFLLSPQYFLSFDRLDKRYEAAGEEKRGMRVFKGIAGGWVLRYILVRGMLGWQGITSKTMS